MLASNAAQQQVISERVHTVRWRLQKERGGAYTQRRFGERLGKGKNWMSQVESGAVKLDVFELYALAEALETSVDYLLGITDDPTTTGNPASTRRSPDTLSDLRIRSAFDRRVAVAA